MCLENKICDTVSVTDKEYLLCRGSLTFKMTDTELTELAFEQALSVKNKNKSI